MRTETKPASNSALAVELVTVCRPPDVPLDHEEEQEGEEEIQVVVAVKKIRIYHRMTSTEATYRHSKGNRDSFQPNWRTSDDAFRKSLPAVLVTRKVRSFFFRHVLQSTQRTTRMCLSERLDYPEGSLNSAFRKVPINALPKMLPSLRKNCPAFE